MWCIKFGPRYAQRLKRRHTGFGDTFYIDDVFVKIRVDQHYLWRAVDPDADIVDVFLRLRRNGNAVKRSRAFASRDRAVSSMSRVAHFRLD